MPVRDVTRLQGSSRFRELDLYRRTTYIGKSGAKNNAERQVTDNCGNEDTGNVDMTCFNDHEPI